MSDKDKMPEDNIDNTDEASEMEATESEVLSEAASEQTSESSNDSLRNSLPFEALDKLLQMDKIYISDGNEGDLEGRVGELEAAFETWVKEWAESDKRMERADRAMRSHFTNELEKFREAIAGELYIRATQRLLMDLLPILNDLDIVLARSEEAEQDERTARLWKVLSAYRRRFYNSLRRLGLEDIDVVERETMFDPQIHECIEPDQGDNLSDIDMLPPGIILKVYRKGYLFQGELFQAPQVIIKGVE